MWIFQLKIKLIKLFTCLIPCKSLRRVIRDEFLYWWNFRLDSNRFIILSSDNKKQVLKKIKRIKGLKIHVDGNNNTIIIHKPFNFINSKIVLNGDNNFIEIGYGNPRIKNLEILLNSRNEDRTLKIGNGFSIESGKFILKGDKQKIIIGNNCMFSNNITIRTSDSHVIRDITTKEQINSDKSVIIGDKVWLAQDVHILKGAEISAGSIVGAGSLLNKKFTQMNVILAGSPAKIVKENVEWQGK